MAEPREHGWAGIPASSIARSSAVVEAYQLEGFWELGRHEACSPAGKPHAQLGTGWDSSQGSLRG